LPLPATIGVLATSTERPPTSTEPTAAAAGILLDRFSTASVSLCFAGRVAILGPIASGSMSAKKKYVRRPSSSESASRPEER
jgi:hypothetical protein